jgi:hypothetical protein
MSAVVMESGAVMWSPRAGSSVTLTETSEPPGLSVAGVLDLPDVEPFIKALETVAEHAPGDVSVDFRGLRAACAEAMPALVRAARRLAADDRRLIARSLPSPQRQLLALARWDRAPGLVVTD